MARVANNRARSVLPHPKSARVGRQPYDLETMLRIHLMQYWYALRARAMEETRYDTPVMSRFALLGGRDLLPDATTIRNFRRLLENHGLAEQLFPKSMSILPKGLGLHGGTFVDAMLIVAPARSTKNRTR